jgi:predicted transcriptional regulator
MQQTEGGNANPTTATLDPTVSATASIVAAYVAHNRVDMPELTGLIQSVHKELTAIATGATAPATRERPEPAVAIRKSVQPDFIVDLFTGKKFKSLKRHLRTVHNMTPEEYRWVWVSAGVRPRPPRLRLLPRRPPPRPPRSPLRRLRPRPPKPRLRLLKRRLPKPKLRFIY